MKRIKNIEIAKALGISPAAVSIALNNKAGVSDETRQKVLDYINSQQNPQVYADKTASDSGKSLILSIHKRHGAIIIEKPFFSGLLEAIQIEAAQNGYSLIISHFNPDTDKRTYIESLNAQKPSGVIILATEMLKEDMEYYQKLSAPYVLMDSYFNLIPCDSVTIDNFNAIVRAYAYAYEMGHRDIGFLQSSVFINNFEHRIDGFLKAQRMFGLDDHIHPIFALPTSIDSAYHEMAKILDNLPDDFQMPTCFLSDLDYIAIGAMQALKERGYKIPEDISIIGFDDVESSLVCDPALTTIHLHQKTIGRESVRLLLQRIKDPNRTYVDIRITSEIVERNSVKKLV